MKIFKSLLLILVFLLCLAGVWIYLVFSLPGNETVMQEFLKQNPDIEKAEISEVSLIFDHAPKDVLTYLVKVKESDSDEKKLYDFAMKKEWNFQWRWCDDQTERKCD